uniref:Proteasome alpha-type subunits domain-containing protein n=1 Tax=Balaenoptera musculus TaxID=9771 RepID=A0A8C0D6W2_BALMU
MSSIGTGYDLSASTFSPVGRVFQVAFAMKPVENSRTGKLGRSERVAWTYIHYQM